MALTRDEQGERTEAPTSARLSAARQSGQVPRSSDLVSVAAVGAGLAGLAVFGRGVVASLVGMVSAMLGPRAGVTRSLGGGELAGQLASVCLAAAPVIILPLVGAVAANLLQTGLVFSTDPVSPDLGRIAPAVGLRRIWSIRTLVLAATSIAKIAVVAAVVIWSVPGLIVRAGAISLGGPDTMLAAAGSAVLQMGLRVVAVLGVLAIADLLYQRWQYKRDLRMTKRELLEDLRSTEGRGRADRKHKRLAGQLANRKLTLAMARARAVVLASNGIAVAVGEHPAGRGLRVTGLGGGQTVAHLRACAQRYGTAVVEDDALVGEIRRRCRVGDVLASELSRRILRQAGGEYILRPAAANMANTEDAISHG